MLALEADLTLVDGTLVPNLVVRIGDDGRIADVVGRENVAERLRLPGQALLPGLVNAHSHAFQRALRGRTETRDPNQPGDNFWTWREQMYALASGLSPEGVHAVASMTYLEMLLSGITTVGEFHYLHHGPNGVPYANPEELALQVNQAALDCGINLVLLRVAYARAGFERPVAPPQRRFFDTDFTVCIESVQRLRGQGIVCGVAPHSVRAVPRPWLAPLHRFATENRLPFHMHVAEQPAEVEACVRETGLRPVQLLAAEGCLDTHTTCVHAIHLLPAEIELLGKARSTICICPTTERNLGDGIAPADALRGAGAVLALGSDSHTQIDLLEDAREVEYHLRLQSLSRVVLSNGNGLARRLWKAATEGGSRSLGTPGGCIAPGRAADLVSITLDDPSVCAEDPDEILTNIVFSMNRAAIRNVWTRGRQVVADGRHERQEQIVSSYRKTIRGVWNS